MSDESNLQHVAVHLSGQDDNLGDSILRAGLLQSLRGRNRRIHILVRDQSGNNQTSDYMSGLTLKDTDVVHDTRASWIQSTFNAVRPVFVLNAGEINPRANSYPGKTALKELKQIRAQQGVTIAAGVGIKDPNSITADTFAPAFETLDLMSWRDFGSREAAGFGEVNPDWAFALGTPTKYWQPITSRPYLSVTLRFDRPYPDQRWLSAVQYLAQQTNTRVVTFAQVGRDAPRAVRLASDLNGEYFGAPSFSHDALDDHVRSLFAQSLAVVTDRAHGLIIGATEGAYPIGSGSDPQKIVRLLETVGLGSLVGRYQDLATFGERLDDNLAQLTPAIDQARNDLARLRVRIQALLGSVEP